MPWNMLSSTIVQSSGCIFAQADMVKKIYFPREVLVLSVATSQLVNFLISYLVAFIIVLFSGMGVNFRTHCIIFTINYYNRIYFYAGVVIDFGRS